MYDILTVESSYRISEAKYAVLKRYILDIEPVIDVKVDEVSSQKLNISYLGPSADVEHNVRTLLEIHRVEFEGSADYKFVSEKELPCQCGEVHSSDITSELIDQGLISYSPSGDFYYSEALRQAIESIDTKFLDYFRKHQEFEYLYSQPLININSLEKIQSLDQLSREALIATHFDGVDIKELNQSVGQSRAVLQSAPCLKVYLHFEAGNIVKNRLISTRGICFRNESKELFTFERMLAFNQRELIALGDSKHVQSMRDFLISHYVTFLQNIGLDTFVEAANDPFFMDSNNKGKYQISGDVKTEIRVALSKSKSISVGSFDYHGTFFGQKCDISKGSETAQSGCLGIGLERVVWAALQQKGINWVKSNL